MSKFGSEKYSVHKPLINYLCEPRVEYIASDNKKIFINLGWQRISREEVLRLRGSETNLVLRDIFITQIKKLNPFITDDITNELIKKIEMLPATIEGNLTAWEYLKGLKTIFVPSEKRERNVKFIDENVENNIFQITDEFSYTNGIKTNRYDVVLLINGVPIFFIETKAAHKIEGIAEALDQVRRYHIETPEAMALFQMYAITHLIRFYYSATWNFSVKNIFNWKAESKASDFEMLVKSFFDKKKIIKDLLYYILFTRQDDELKKVVLRPHQIRAIEKLIERAKDKTKRRALIWHTQGSGKTYTMITTAKRIIEDPYFKNPTVLMVVDRNELESQLFLNLKSVGFEIDESRIARSKRHLIELLKSDIRGLVISMIHKFDEIPTEINTRENFFVLIDEAHRTIGGDLGNYLMAALPNATYIGFTGTPIDKTQYGKGTFKIFGADDVKGYLDKYSIAESIEDGTTVKLHYALAPNELRPDSKTLEKEFFALADIEGVSDIELLNKVLDKAVNLKNMLKNSKRVSKVAEYVARHFKEYVEPMGYKAFFVAVDREACVMYKKELDKFLPPEFSEVIISRGVNDSPYMQAFHYSEDKEKQIRKAFRNAESKPKILIVTEKLLTGYDAPILYCMYLDKPMRDHALLQAIARVNRPYEDENGRKKTCGFVLDFVGIFDKLEKALAFDSGDIADIKRVIKDIERLKLEFKNGIEQAKNKYLSIIQNKTLDKQIEALLDYFIDEEERKEFYQFYKELADMYEIISPDVFLRPYIDDYDTLSRIYKIIKEAYDPGIIIDKEFARKTAKLVQEHTTTLGIKSVLDVYEINEDTLKKLAESSASDIEKVINLIKSIFEKVKNESENNPYLISIGEKAELISEMFKERQKTTEETLEALKKLVAEINTAKEEQKSIGLDRDAFTVYWILKENRIINLDSIARSTDEILKQYPHWKISKEHEREVRRKIYTILIQNKIENPQDLVEKIIKILKRSRQ